MSESAAPTKDPDISGVKGKNTTAVDVDVPKGKQMDEEQDNNRAYKVRTVAVKSGGIVRVGPDDLVFLDGQTETGLTHFVVLERIDLD